MSFELTEEQRALVAGARSVVLGELAAVAARGERGRVNRDLVAALGSSGLLARVFPDGGTVSAMDLCLLREALAQESTEAETALAMQGLGAYPILRPAARAGRRVDPAGRPGRGRRGVRAQRSRTTGPTPARSSCEPNPTARVAAAPA